MSPIHPYKPLVIPFFNNELDIKKKSSITTALLQAFKTTTMGASDRQIHELVESEMKMDERRNEFVLPP